MNPTTDKEQFTRSSVLTTRLPTLVRLAETLTQDFLNKQAMRNGDAIRHENETNK